MKSLSKDKRLEAYKYALKEQKDREKICRSYTPICWTLRDWLQYNTKYKDIDNNFPEFMNKYPGDENTIKGIKGPWWCTGDHTSRIKCLEECIKEVELLK